MQLKTKRLILRNPTLKDAKALCEGIGNLEISKWLLVVPYPYTIKDANWWIRKCLRDEKKNAKKKDREDYGFNIELREERKIIGGMSLHHVKKDQGTATLGYWISQKYWGKGYASEALSALLNFAFNKLKLRRLEAEVFVGNDKSKGLAQKFGFKEEGIRRQSAVCKATGKVHDAYVLGLIRKDYKAK